MSKIIFINRYFYPDHSATSQLLSDLAFDLAGQGRNVEVISSAQLYDNARANLARRECINGVTVHRIRTTSYGRKNLMGRAMDYLTFYASATILMLRTVNANDLLIAETDPPLISLFAMMVAKVRRAKLINWVQDIFPEVAVAIGVSGLRPMVVRCMVWFRDLSWRAASCNVVLGQRMEVYLKQRGINDEQIRVIHNWSSGSSVRPVKREDNALRAEWGLADKFVVGYSGNLGRAHDYQTMIDVAVLMSNNDNIRFLYIGGGAHRESVERQVEKKGLGNVLFKPYQSRDRLAESLSIADLHVISLLPDLEGYIVPSKFYGILAVGRPTLYVGHSEGEIPRILDKWLCGTTVKIGDSESFAEYVTMLAAEQNKCERIGRRARELFTEYFDKKLAINRWTELIESQKMVL